MYKSSIVSIMMFTFVAAAQDPDTDEGRAALEKEVQSPIASLISIPFQDNLNFNNCPYGRVQSVLNIQPVIPPSINENWNLITRVITPVVYQPDINTSTIGTSGLGDTTPTFFLSPAKGKLIWGAGPVFLIPTATGSALGSGKWGVGPSVALLVQPGHWTIGALAKNILVVCREQRIVKALTATTLSGSCRITSAKAGM